METKIYLANISPLEDESLYEKYMAQASRERQEKVSRYRFEKDRRLALGAEVLLRLALGEAGYAEIAGQGEASHLQDASRGEVNFGQGDHLEEERPPQGHPGRRLYPGRALVYGRGEKGKPYLPAHPDFHFNWSHAGEWVMLAVSDREVGCDIEQIRPVELKLARYAFAPWEYQQLAAYNGDERDTLFFRFWVLKESYMKATGEGLSLGTASFCIELGEPFGNQGDGASQAFRRETPIRVIRDGGMQDFSFLEGDDIPGYRHALCLEGALPTVEKEIVDLRELL